MDKVYFLKRANDLFSKILHAKSNFADKVSQAHPILNPSVDSKVLQLPIPEQVVDFPVKMNNIFPRREDQLIS